MVMLRRHVVKVMMFMVMSMMISVIQMMQLMQRIRFAVISDMYNFLTTYLPTYLIDIELNFGMNSLV
jgi:hypothetical protein